MAFGVRKRVVLAVALGVGAFACKREAAPRDIRLELPDIIASADPVAVIVHTTAAEGMTTRESGELAYAVKPNDLGTISPRGIFVCQKSGDGTISVTVVGVTKSAPVRCRLVERIDAGDNQVVEFAAGGFAPKVRALSRDGQELTDVQLSLTSKTPGVLVPIGGELVPKSVGTAKIVARVGQVAREFTVHVERALTPEALPIDGNRRIHFSLSPGKYRLKASLPEARRFTVEWRGAPYCNYSGTEREHVSVCVLRTKGGAVFDNPAYLMRQSTDVSVDGVTLHEVP